jgi:hypothetical protein
MVKYLNFLIGVRTGSGSDRVPYDAILKTLVARRNVETASATVRPTQTATVDSRHDIG